MPTVTLEEAQIHLAKLLGRLEPNEEIIITQHGLPLASVKKVGQTLWPCKAGSAAGKIHMT